MKTYLIIIVLFLSFNFVMGQKYSKNIFKQNSTDDYHQLTPLFEHEVYDTTGKTIAVYFFKEISDLKNLSNRSLESVLSKDSINRLERNSGSGRAKSLIYMTIDYTGRIREITFHILKHDREILTDQVMHKLYQKMIKTQININKVEINHIKIVPKEQIYTSYSIPLYWFK